MSIRTFARIAGTLSPRFTPVPTSLRPNLVQATLDIADAERFEVEQVKRFPVRGVRNPRA